MNNIVDLVQSYINQGIDSDVVHDVVEDYINEFNLGEYL